MDVRKKCEMYLRLSQFLKKYSTGTSGESLRFERGREDSGYNFTKVVFYGEV